MAYLDPRNYVPSVKEMVNYGCDIHWDGYTVMKNHGDYIRLMFPSSAAKGHDTYDLYLDSNGRLWQLCSAADYRANRIPLVFQ